MQSSQDYSPSSYYPNYVGWRVVLACLTPKALSSKDKEAVHLPVHHA